jgi:hypothetical protein
MTYFSFEVMMLRGNPLTPDFLSAARRPLPAAPHSGYHRLNFNFNFNFKSAYKCQTKQHCEQS